jgi:arylformamidase
MIEPPPDTNEWFEYQYNPRLTVKDAASILPEWRKRALVTREMYPPMGDIKYGPHPRENLDLFRAPNAKASVIYIHGGYWRMLSKLETSWVAGQFVEQGISVALVNYPLCPDVPLALIRNAVQRAFAHMWHHVLTPDERQTIIVTGHSAGGHLAALLIATDWTAFNLPANPIAGVVSLSGVYDVVPLVNTSMNAELRLTQETAAPMNLLVAKPVCKASLLLAVGANEPRAFHDQSESLAQSWVTLKPEVLSLPATNHYTIVDHLASADGVLHKHVCAIAGQGTAG